MIAFAAKANNTTFFEPSADTPSPFEAFPVVDYLTLLLKFKNPYIITRQNTRLCLPYPIPG